MDVGNSLNPTIDIGQIEGAFVQGLGWVTLEELVWYTLACGRHSPSHTHTHIHTLDSSCSRQLPLLYLSFSRRAKNQSPIPDGWLLTRGPGTYKIPGFNDIPIEVPFFICCDRCKCVSHSSSSMSLC
jgi:xanthine dehydrogenase molybdopterin-binding subunit B